MAIPVEASAGHDVVTLRDGGILIGELDPALRYLRTAFGFVEVPSQAVASQMTLHELPLGPPLRFRTSSGQLHLGSAVNVKGGVLTILRADGQLEQLQLASVLEINDLARFGPGQPQLYPLPGLAAPGAVAVHRPRASDSAWPTEKSPAPPPPAAATAPKAKAAGTKATPAKLQVASETPAECTERAGGRAGRRRGESPKSGSSDANAFMRSAFIGLLCPGIGCISNGSYAGYRKYEAPKVPAKCAGSPEYVAAYEKAFVLSRKSTVKTRTWLGGAVGTAVALFLLVQIAAELDGVE